jgi:hypothetical protein
MPRSWKESLLISASKSPMLDIAAAAWIETRSQGPPIHCPTSEKNPSVHSAAVYADSAPVPARSGKSTG